MDRIFRSSVLGILVVAAGCSVSVAPAWPTRTQPIGASETDFVSQMAKHAASPQSNPRMHANQPPYVNPNYSAAMFPADGPALMFQRLANAEEESRTLKQRMGVMESRLNEKDQAVTTAKYEIKETIDQLRKEREEALRNRSELDDLRSRIRTMDRDHKSSLQTIIKSLDYYLESTKPQTPKNHLLDQ